MQQKGKIHVYCLIDPRTNKVRYVGSTANAGHRFINHIHSGKQPWIRELKQEGLRPQLEILETTNEIRRYRQEQRWIHLFLYLGADLVNNDPYTRKLKMYGAKPGRAPFGARAQVHIPHLLRHKKFDWLQKLYPWYFEEFGDDTE